MTRPSPLRLACLAAALPAVFAAASGSPLTLEIKDFVELPITGKLDGKGQTDGMLARVNVVARGTRRRDSVLRQRSQRSAVHPRQEHRRRSRPISTSTAARVTPGCSTASPYETGYANGLVSVQFDPGLPAERPLLHRAHRGSVGRPRSPLPDDGEHARSRTCAATSRRQRDRHARRDPARRRADRVDRYEHRATRRSRASARELMRVQLNTRIHPLGDLVFNPAARPGDADWRVLYIGCGDGGSGESTHDHPHQPAASRYAGREDPAHHPGSHGARVDEHRERERPLSDSERQPVRRDAGRAPGDLGATAFAIRIGCTFAIDPADACEQPADRELDRPAHVGNGQHRPQGRELRLLAARRQPRPCSTTTRRRSAARGRQDSRAGDRHGDQRHGRAAPIR